MPRRRLTIATVMLMVVIVSLAIALIRSELKNKAIRAELVRAERAIQIRPAADKLAAEELLEYHRQLYANQSVVVPWGSDLPR